MENVEEDVMKKAVFTQKIRFIGLYCALFGLFATLTCDNSPFSAGLGPKVDILAPVIHQILPVSGEYLRDNLFRFKAMVTDDISVKKGRIILPPGQKHRF